MVDFEKLFKLKQDQWIEACVEIETLKAEVRDRLILSAVISKLESEVVKLKAENERLQYDLTIATDNCDSNFRFCEELQAEVARLRLALYEIQCAYGEPNAEDVVTSTAREALELSPVPSIPQQGGE